MSLEQGPKDFVEVKIIACPDNDQQRLCILSADNYHFLDGNCPIEEAHFGMIGTFCTRNGV
jgi:hypothetical protein